jgi:hypothetical protein
MPKHVGNVETLWRSGPGITPSNPSSAITRYRSRPQSEEGIRENVDEAQRAITQKFLCWEIESAIGLNERNRNYHYMMRVANKRHTLV